MAVWSPTARVRLCSLSVSPIGNRLQKGLDAGGHDLRRLPRKEPFDHPDPVSEYVVGDHPIAGQRLHRREFFRRNPAKQPQVLDQIVNVVRVGRDHDQRSRCILRKRRHAEGARRPPDSIQGDRVAGVQIGQNLVEALMTPQASDQLQEPARRGGGFLGLCHDSRSRGVVRPGVSLPLQ